MTIAPVRCHAIVDLMNKMGPSRPIWRVTVTGDAPYAQTRIYAIPAATDGQAAMAGMRKFEQEMLKAAIAANPPPLTGA